MSSLTRPKNCLKLTDRSIPLRSWNQSAIEIYIYSISPVNSNHVKSSLTRPKKTIWSWQIDLDRFGHGSCCDWSIYIPYLLSTPNFWSSNSLPRTYMKYLQIETFTCPLPTTVGFVLFRCGLSLHQLAVTRIQKTLRNPNLLRTKSSKLGLCTLLRTCPNLNHPYNFLSAYDVLLFMLRQCKEKACRLSEKGARWSQLLMKSLGILQEIEVSSWLICHRTGIYIYI